MFNSTTPIAFAGNISYYPPNTIKINVMIKKWPFYSLSNFLAVVLDVHIQNLPSPPLSPPPLLTSLLLLNFD